MWDCCCESVKKIEKSSGSGCILAHCMGLGKTLQVRRKKQHPSLFKSKSHQSCTLYNKKHSLLGSISLLDILTFVAGMFLKLV